MQDFLPLFYFLFNKLGNHSTKLCSKGGALTIKCKSKFSDLVTAVNSVMFRQLGSVQ